MKRELNESVVEELMKFENLFQEHDLEFRDIFVSKNIIYYVSTDFGLDTSFIVYFNDSFDAPEHWIVIVKGCGVNNHCLVVCEDGIGCRMEDDYISVCYLDFLKRDKNEAFSVILKKHGPACEWPNPVAGQRNNNFYSYLKLLKGQ